MGESTIIKLKLDHLDEDIDNSPTDMDNSPTELHLICKICSWSTWPNGMDTSYYQHESWSTGGSVSSLTKSLRFEFSHSSNETLNTDWKTKKKRNNMVSGFCVGIEIFRKLFYEINCVWISLFN